MLPGPIRVFVAAEDVDLDAFAETAEGNDHLRHRPASVDEQISPGDQRGGGRGQENHSAGDIHRIADAPEWDMVEDVRMELRIIEGRARAVGPDESRRNAVDGDAMRCSFERQATRQVIYRCLGHAIDRLALEHDATGLRADVDDPP